MFGAAIYACLYIVGKWAMISNKLSRGSMSLRG